MRGTLAAVLLVAALGSGCAGSSTRTPDLFADATRLTVPPTIGGLTAGLEKDATKQLVQTGGDRSYVADGWVYTLRSGEELRGVLEVIRLDADARPADRIFRRTILGQIGGKINDPQRIDGTLVWEGKINEQKIYMWFKGRFLQVLMLRQEETVQGEGVGYDPQTLVREAVAINPN